MRSSTEAVPTRCGRSSSLCLVLLVLVVACASRDTGVTIKGDAAALDSMSRIGDSLVAQLSQSSPSLDSMHVEIAAKLRLATATGRGETSSASLRGTASPTQAAPTSNPAARDNGMTARAVARGDSMARAQALRYAGSSNSGKGARGDTLRGIVTLIGSAPAKQVVLRSSSVTAPVALSGMVTSGLSHLAGTEIVVRGVKVTPRDWVVTSYVVRAMNGIPALDGVVEVTNNSWTLRLTETGLFKRLTNVPAALKASVGARVWVTTLVGSSTPVAFGVVPTR